MGASLCCQVSTHQHQVGHTNIKCMTCTKLCWSQLKCIILPATLHIHWHMILDIAAPNGLFSPTALTLLRRFLAQPAPVSTSFYCEMHKFHHTAITTESNTSLTEGSCVMHYTSPINVKLMISCALSPCSRDEWPQMNRNIQAAPVMNHGAVNEIALEFAKIARAWTCLYHPECTTYDQPFPASQWQSLRICSVCNVFITQPCTQQALETAVLLNAWSRPSMYQSV